jgi:hypothetical protein
MIWPRVSLCSFWRIWGDDRLDEARLFCPEHSFQGKRGQARGSISYPNEQSTVYNYLGITRDERLSEIKNLTPASAVLS